MGKIIKIKESFLNKAINEVASEMKEMSKISSQISDVEWWPITDKPERAYKIYANGKQISVINKPINPVGTEGNQQYEIDLKRNLAMLLAVYSPEEITIKVPEESDKEMIRGLNNDDYFLGQLKIYTKHYFLRNRGELEKLGLEMSEIGTYIRRNIDVSLKRIGISSETKGDFSEKGGNIIGQIHTQYIYEGEHYRFNDLDLIPDAVAKDLKPTVTALFYLTNGISPDEFIQKHGDVIKEAEEVAEIVYFIPVAKVPVYVEQSRKYGFQKGEPGTVQATKEKTIKMPFDISERIRREMYPHIEKIIQSPELVDFFYKNLLPPIIFEEKYRPSSSQSKSTPNLITTGTINFLSFSSNQEYYDGVRKYIKAISDTSNNELERLKNLKPGKDVTNAWRETASSLWEKADIANVMKTYHLQRQWNTVYETWNPSKKNARTPDAGKTRVYKLDERGYVPENLDVTLKSEFSLGGKLLDDGTWAWKADYDLMLGRKSFDSSFVKSMVSVITPISVEMISEAGGDALKNGSIWETLDAVLNELKNQIMSLSGEHFELPRLLSYYDREMLASNEAEREDERLAVHENYMNKLTSKILKDIEHEKSN